jgi:hypothetical protein
MLQLSLASKLGFHSFYMYWRTVEILLLDLDSKLGLHPLTKAVFVAIPKQLFRTSTSKPLPIVPLPLNFELLPFSGPLPKKQNWGQGTKP